MRPEAIDADLEAAARRAARMLRESGVSGVQTRQIDRGPGVAPLYQVRGKIQIGRAHQTVESITDPNIVTATFDLVARANAMRADSKRARSRRR